MAMNPADQAYENNKNEIEKLQAEVCVVVRQLIPGKNFDEHYTNRRSNG